MRHRNCNVKLDDLEWDRPDLDCELQQARGVASTKVVYESDPVVRSGVS